MKNSVPLMYNLILVMYRQLSQEGTAAALWARSALTAHGWEEEVQVEIDTEGRIQQVRTGVPRSDAATRALAVDLLLPAAGNLHSHAFQRGMAGLSERRLAGSSDSFWTWREVMYHFVERLTPEDVEAVAALVYVEMLETGYASVGEFHYLHHTLDGSPYEDIAELTGRIYSAAARTGIGLTHLPVLYCRGGLAEEALAGGQRRFGCTPDRFSKLWQKAERDLTHMPADTRLGVAPHSLRAVDRDELTFATELAPSAPLHLHIAEQTAEVDAVEAAYGRRPVSWLLDEFDVDERWCLIHSTQMNEAETGRLAATRAVAGLCPITESNLGDGIFDGRRFLAADGRFGVGSDSNVRIALAEELRTLEYSQRLRDRERSVLVQEGQSVGRTLYEGVTRGGAQALGRGSGVIEAGALADLVALRDDPLTFGGLDPETRLDSWIFTGDDGLVDHVWAAGRHVVQDGRHRDRDSIVRSASKVLQRIRAAL